MPARFEQKPPPWSHIGFMALVGLIGWALLLVPHAVPGLVPDVQPELAHAAMLVFLITVVAARSMAFMPLPGTVISIDSGFYIAATLCFGSIASGRLVALALTVDALLRLVTGSRRRSSRAWLDAVVYVLYFGGMSGALLAVIARMISADATAVFYRGDELRMLGSVVAIGVTFILLHYVIQGVRIRLAGERAYRYLTRMGLPAVLAELTLLPLAAVVVFVYDPKSLLGLGLLGGTYLLIAFGFNRLSKAGAKLRQRVRELETLNATSSSLSGCLHIHQLIEAVAQATLEALRSADALAFCRPAGREPDSEADDGETLYVDAYLAGTDEYRRSRASSSSGLAAEVLRIDAPISVNRIDEAGTALDRARSWLGVPVQVYGEAEAVLVVESHRVNAFTQDDQRVLSAIAAQTAVALQNVRHYELAMVDGLTRLFVRRYFDARLDEEIERSRRFETTFAVAMIDIDDFKALNDAHGHAVGDVALQRVAEVVRSEMRGIDTAARYGGEEFALVLPRTSLTDAYAQAERIRKRLLNIRLPAKGASGEDLVVTASFGIAAYPESGADNAEELLRLADRALYRAKRTGKNRVELYWPEDETERRASVRPVER